MKALVVISAPSLNESNNVSGVASVVRNIIKMTTVDFCHFKIGSKDSQNGKLGKVYRNISSVFKLWRVLRKNRHAIYHSNTSLLADAIVRDWLFCLIAKFMGCTVLLHLHGGAYMLTLPESKLINNFIRKLFILANVIVVLSSREKEYLIDSFGVNLEKIHVLPNCVDCNDSVMRYKESVAKVAKVRCLYFGRIDEAKGVREIVGAIEGMVNKNRISLLVCGAGPLKNWFCEKMEDLLGNDFIYAGIVKGDDKWDVFAEVDYFLLPSRYEGLPMSLLETMGAGVVPIVSDIPALTELVDTNSGFTVKAGDKLSLQKTLDSLVFGECDYSSKSECCRSIVKNNFSCVDMRQSLNLIYKKLSMIDVCES